MTHEASHWHPLDDGAVGCDLCPSGCLIEEGTGGLCATRANVDGRLVAREYGRLVSAGVDPIEKKPLYHFLPGRPILSIAAQGCNLRCVFCQNWTISQQRDHHTEAATPEQVAAQADEGGSVGVAYTYSEPLVWFEFVRDTARLVHAAGLKNVIVSNGYLNREPLLELLPFIDAANIDIKSMDDRFYREICGGRLQPVLDTVILCHEMGVHLEITNLVIPGNNDGEDQVKKLVDFVADLDPTIPLHFSAYHPAYRFDAPPTPPQTLQRLRDLARRRLDHVYLGNVAGDDGSDTRCPDCEAVVVVRRGYRADLRCTPEGRCPECGSDVHLVLS